ncbi:MAG: hypothetical protein ACKVI3_03235 [Verrucomicrobiia bacterium]
MLLFFSAFAGATLLPLSSEVAFGVAILTHPNSLACLAGDYPRKHLRCYLQFPDWAWTAQMAAIPKTPSQPQTEVRQITLRSIRTLRDLPLLATGHRRPPHDIPRNP